MQETKDSPLEKWLRKRNMTTNRLVELVGCSRPIVWKAKRGIPICPLYANRIAKITNNEVIPISEKVGRQKL